MTYSTDGLTVTVANPTAAFIRALPKIPHHHSRLLDDASAMVSCVTEYQRDGVVAALERVGATRAEVA